MKKYITKANALKLVCIVLFIIILLQRCNKDVNNCPTEVTKIEYKHDTVYVPIKETVQSKPQIAKTYHDKKPKKEDEKWFEVPVVVKGADCDTLQAKYNELRTLYLAHNIVPDTLYVKSLGKVIVTDTLHKNKIEGRSFTTDFQIPVITNTITKTVAEKKRNQFYLGIGLEGNKYDFLNQYNAYLALKNKKDHLYLIKAGIDNSGNVNYGVGTFFKIKLHK